MAAAAQPFSVFAWNHALRNKKVAVVSILPEPDIPLDAQESKRVILQKLID